MGRAQQPQPVERWPRWLHFGCVGCSIVVAGALVGAAASVAVLVHRHIQRGREPSDSRSPIVTLENGCVGIVRAAGYEAWEAAALPDGRILALGSPVPSFPSLFAEALQHFVGPEQAGADFLRHFIPRLFLLAADQPRTEVSLPERDGSIAAVEEFCVDAGGRRIAVSVVFLSRDQNVDHGYAAPAEIWSLDLRTEQWHHVLSLSPDRQVRLLGWVPSGHSIAAMRRREGKQEAQLCLIALDGTLRHVAMLPGITRYWRLVAGGKVMELAYLGDVGEENGARGLYSVDLDSGRVVRRQIAVIPAAQPGPLASGEELFFRHGRLGALCWQASRIRWLTWPLGAIFSAAARLDGRWALVSVGPADGTSGPDRLVAVNLSDGRARLVAKGEFTVLAAAPDGHSFWVSVSSEAANPLSDENAQILQVYTDWDALSRAGPTQESMPAGTARAASGSPRRN